MPTTRTSHVEKTTHVYRTVANDPPFTGETRISADVYRPAGDDPRPVLVYLHGGAMINGSRADVKLGLPAFAQANGLILVSLDYRLGPEVKVPQIVEDVRAAWAWIHQRGPELFGADLRRVAVAGMSAGGYLALNMGTFQPRPVAVASFWGYGSILGDWYTRPAPPYSGMPVDRTVALAEVGRAVLTQTGEAAGVKPRRAYYTWLRHEGLWTRQMTGFDPHTQRDRIAPYCPVEHLDRDYPPTLLVHGDADDDVPVQESLDMAAALEAQGVEHELIVVPGAGHVLRGVGEAEVQPVLDRAQAFLQRRLDAAR